MKPAITDAEKNAAQSHINTGEDHLIAMDALTLGTARELGNGWIGIPAATIALSKVLTARQMGGTVEADAEC